MPSRIRSLSTVAAAAMAATLGVAVPSGAASAATAAPVVRASAVVFAPTGGTGATIDVGVSAGRFSASGAQVTGQRQAGGGMSYSVDYDMEATLPDAGGAVAGAVANTHIRAGDPIEIRLAATDAYASPSGSPAKVDAVRAVDLRTGATVLSVGRRSLLAGAPAYPAHQAKASGRDVILARSFWGHGWKGSAVQLANVTAARASGEGPPGVTDHGTRFLVTDLAHPKGVGLGTTKLQARTGDRVTVTVTAPPTGRRVKVVVADRRTGRQVASAG